MAVNLLPQALPNTHTEGVSRNVDDAGVDAAGFADALAAASTRTATPGTQASANRATRGPDPTESSRTTESVTGDADLLAALLSGTTLPTAAATLSPPGAAQAQDDLPTRTCADKPRRDEEPAIDAATLAAASLALLAPAGAVAQPVTASASTEIPRADVRIGAGEAKVRADSSLRDAAAETALRDAVEQGEAAVQAHAKAAMPATPELAPTAVAAPQHKDASAKDISMPLNASVPAAGASNPPPVQLTVATPAFTPPWRDEIAQQLTQLVLMRQDRAEIRLHPADLGPVTVHIVMDGSKANLLIEAPQPATRDGLELALPHLRDSLGELGITLGEASIRHHGERDAQRDGSPPLESPRPAQAVAESEPVVRAQLGLVDLFA